MVTSMVERATSSVLIGPDWAMNIEICDMLNHDPSQAKAIVKDIKKRLGSRNSKVQLLTLTLLESTVKNCGDIVHIHVVEKGILYEMVKIVKKKPDFHVKEKILILIDTWQEAFGGPRARYPQFYAAYQELLRAGTVFPQRAENSAPVFTPPQTQPLASRPQNLRNPHYQQDAAGTSAESEFPALSLSEIQNARGIMDVLSEMVTALDPVNKDAIRQEVIVDLVEQCRVYKHRVVHLVNVTADESLLCQGLALNDDLERILAKHDAIASGTPIPLKNHVPVTVTARAVVDVDDHVVDAGRNNKNSLTEDSNSSQKQSLLPVPPASNGTATLVSVDLKMDLLSGDDYNSPSAEPSLALVPLVQPQPTSPVSDHNALILFDMFSNTSNTSNSTNGNGRTKSLTSQYSYPNGNTANVGLHHNQQSAYMNGPSTTWNGQATHQQQPPPAPGYGAQSGGSLPPPPWEAQPVYESSHVTGPQYPHQMQFTQVAVTNAQINELPHGQFGNEQVVGMLIQPITGSQLSAINRQASLSNHLRMHPPHQIQGGSFLSVVPQPMQNGQMTSIYSLSQQMPGYGNQYGGYAYDYGQSQQTQYIQQRAYGLSLRDDNGLRNPSYQVSTTASTYVPPTKPAKPEDKLFGDLVDMAKFRSTKTT